MASITAGQEGHRPKTTPLRRYGGFELQVGTNHLGPFALTMLLLPHITDRVVTVSSEMHKRGRIDPADLNGDQRSYESFQTYCDTKLANLLFAFELQRRLARAGSNVRSLAAHPGIAKTSLAAHVTGLKGLGLKVLASFAQDAEHGALPSCTTHGAAREGPPDGQRVGPAAPADSAALHAPAIRRRDRPARPVKPQMPQLM